MVRSTNVTWPASSVDMGVSLFAGPRLTANAVLVLHDHPHRG